MMSLEGKYLSPDMGGGGGSPEQRPPLRYEGLRFENAAEAWAKTEGYLTLFEQTNITLRGNRQYRITDYEDAGVDAILSDTKQTVWINELDHTRGTRPATEEDRRRRAEQFFNWVEGRVVLQSLTDRLMTHEVGGYGEAVEFLATWESLGEQFSHYLDPIWEIEKRDTMLRLLACRERPEQMNTIFDEIARKVNTKTGREIDRSEVKRAWNLERVLLRVAAADALYDRPYVSYFERIPYDPNNTQIKEERDRFLVDLNDYTNEGQALIRNGLSAVDYMSDRFVKFDALLARWDQKDWWAINQHLKPHKLSTPFNRPGGIDGAFRAVFRMDHWVRQRFPKYRFPYKQPIFDLGANDMLSYVIGSFGYLPREAYDPNKMVLFPGRNTGAGVFDDRYHMLLSISEGVPEGDEERGVKEQWRSLNWGLIMEDVGDYFGTLAAVEGLKKFLPVILDDPEASLRSEKGKEAWVQLYHSTEVLLSQHWVPPKVNDSWNGVVLFQNRREEWVTNFLAYIYHGIQSKNMTKARFTEVPEGTYLRELDTIKRGLTIRPLINHVERILERAFFEDFEETDSAVPIETGSQLPGNRRKDLDSADIMQYVAYVKETRGGKRPARF